MPKRGWRSYIPFINKGENSDVRSQNSDVKNQDSDVRSQKSEKKKKEAHTITLTDENLGKQYILSNCCHPIPGDEVLGYLDEDGKMYIHKIDCSEAKLLKTSYGKRIYSARRESNPHFGLRSPNYGA